MKYFSFIGSLLLLTQVSFCIWFCYTHGFSSQVLYIFDGDATRHTELAMKASLFADLGWYGYGPFYYKFAYLLAALFPNVFLYDINSTAFHQSSAVTALSLSHIVFIYCYSLSLGKLARLPKEVVPLFVITIVALIFSNNTLLRYNFRAYPDATLAALLGLAYAVALIERGKAGLAKSLPIIASMIFWAAAVQTKISAAFFLPGLLVLWLDSRPFISKRNVLFCLTPAVLALAFGYPQNLATLEAWAKVGGTGMTHSLPISHETIFFFLQNFWAQVQQPLVALCLICLFYPVSKAQNNLNVIRLTGTCALGILIPLAFFLAFPLSSPTEHYPMTLAYVSLVLAIAVLHRFTCTFWSFAEKKVPRTIAFTSNAHWIVALVVSVVFLKSALPHYLPLKLIPLTEKVSVCSEQLQNFENVLFKIHGRVFATPYTISYHDTPKHLELRTRWWQPRISGLEKDVKGLIINRRFMSRFLSKSAEQQRYNRTTFDDALLAEITAFAGIISSQTTFTDSFGRKWDKQSAYPACQFELWTTTTEENESVTP
jgi:hypothetical protein